MILRYFKHKRKEGRYNYYQPATDKVDTIEYVDETSPITSKKDNYETSDNIEMGVISGGTDY